MAEAHPEHLTEMCSEEAGLFFRFIQFPTQDTTHVENAIK